jgi:hypothetical protein
VALTDELADVAKGAGRFAARGEHVAAVLVAEPAPGERLFLCAFDGTGGRTWLALDAGGRPVVSRRRVREAVSITALCEVAEESAGGGDLERLRTELLTVRLTERPPGIEQAEAAALELEGIVGERPRVASPARLDAIGAAARRLERSLGEDAGSPFAVAMREAVTAVEALTAEIEGSYKVALD